MSAGHFSGVGNKHRCALVVFALFGCGHSAGPQGASGAAPISAGGASSLSAAGASNTPLSPDDATWTWSACGTIASTPWSSQMYSDFQNLVQPGDAVVGGHPMANEGEASHWHITALAMSADGHSLVSMGGVTLVWDVAPVFQDSRAVYVDSAAPEWPRVNLSPDGQWLAIAGDGWRLLSRVGARGPWLAGNQGCWPAEAKFSPDGKWLVQTFGVGLDVYGVESFANAGDTELQPLATLPAPCGSGRLEGQGSTTRFAFTPDGAQLVTETGAHFSTVDWSTVTTTRHLPVPHTYNGELEVAADGASLLSDCDFNSPTTAGAAEPGATTGCSPFGARAPRFSPNGRWMVAGGVVTHLGSNTQQLLDPLAVVAIFAPNGDIIAADKDNSLTRYCKTE